MSRKERRRRAAAPETPPDDALHEIGRRIRSARERAGLTQEAAAASAGIDYKRWQRLEQGAANPTASTLLRVAEAIDTDLWHLFAPRPRARKPTR